MAQVRLKRPFNFGCLKIWDRKANGQKYCISILPEHSPEILTIEGKQAFDVEKKLVFKNLGKPIEVIDADFVLENYAGILELVD